MPTLERQNLFVQAEDWTDVDSDGDGIPDWWIWMCFGNLNETATNLDSGGNTIGDDYQFYLMSGCFPDVPNVISFTWSCTNQNQCVSTSIVAQVNVTGGMPSFFFAVVLDSTNFAGAAWTAYTSSNILINLGTTPGWHDVWIGLRGWPPNAQPTWQKKHLYLALPPVLVITNPVNATGSTFTRPWLQLQGCGNEPLLAVEYDVTNAAGRFTNQQGFVTDQVFDTNQFDFTTNWFQCYDVPLTNGLNLITLRVADRAGNVTVTNVAITLDYSLATNPPVMNIIWPQDGMAVSGPNFYVRGRLNDETATVTAQVVDAEGNTNAAEGIVERNGMFWVENLPLTNDDNIVTVTATDAAGNVTTTNLTVSESDVGLTIDSTPTGNGLYQPSGTVGGSISDPSYAVWVNGVEADYYASNGATWYWKAANVPVHGRGTMTFDAVAYPAEQEMPANFSARGMQAMNNSPSPANASAAVEAGPYWAVTDYHDNKTTRSLDSDPQNGALYSATWGKNYRARYQPDANGQWVATYQGTMTDHFEYSDHYGSEWIETDYAWSDSGDSMHSTDSYGNDEFWPYLDDAAEVDRVTYVPDEDLTAFGQEGRNPPMFISHYRAAGVAWHWDFPYPRTLDTTVGAATKVTLYTGGKAKMGRQNLFCIHCGATQYGRPADYPSFNAPWLDTPGTNMDVTSLTVMGKHPGSDGNVWIALPDNSEPDMTVTAPADHYSAGASAQKYTSYLTANGFDLDNETPEFCVGQQVTFALNGLPGFVDALGHWSLPGKYVNEQYLYSSNCTSYRVNPDLLNITGQNLATHCWYVNQPGGTVGVNANLHFSNGQYASVSAMGNFTVYRPSVNPVVPHGPFGAAISEGMLSLEDRAMAFDVNINSKYAGAFGLTQLVKMYSETISVPPDVLEFSTTWGSFYLDWKEYYDDLKDKDKTYSIYDAPGQPLLFEIGDYTGNWKDYVRFTPSGGIPVTLGRIDWNWAATCVNLNPLIGWYITSDGVDGPALHDDDSFPLWSHVAPSRE